MLSGHGDDGYAQQTAIRHDFSSNVCREALPEGLLEYLRQGPDMLTHYPEPASESLRALIAKREGVTPASVLVTNGATEAIYLTAQAFMPTAPLSSPLGGKSESAGNPSPQGGSWWGAEGLVGTYILQPTFSEYADACRLYGHRVKGVGRLDEVGEEAAMVWLCNPNNPTGTVIPKTELLRQVSVHPSVVFVVDQSYEAFCREPLLSVREAAAFENLLLLHSMTKQYALPGLRLGYLTGAAKQVKRVERFLQPWSVNALAQRAGQFLSGVRSGEDAFPVEDYLRETRRLRAAIDAMEGMEALPTSTNFFLVRLREPCAGALKQWLAGLGILIRDASNFEGLDGHYVRIAAQRPEENDLLIEKLRQWSTR